MPTALPNSPRPKSLSKYKGESHANHHIRALESLYKVTTDCKGKLYSSITLKWYYDARTVNISIPGYVQAQLHKYHHQKPRQPEHSPYCYERSQYGVKQKLTKDTDTSEILYDNENLRTKQYLAAGIKDTAQALCKFLNYCATHLDAVIHYHSIGMVLYIAINASYLTSLKDLSRVCGHY